MTISVMLKNYSLHSGNFFLKFCIQFYSKFPTAHTIPDLWQILHFGKHPTSGGYTVLYICVNYCSSNDPLATHVVNLYIIPLVTFGRIVGAVVEPLENFQTLQQNTTLYCSTDLNTNTARIGWSFTPFGQEIEESLTDSAQWEPAFSISKLYISTSKLGYYSCHTSEGYVLKKYIVKLTQPSLDKGMCVILYVKLNMYHTPLYFQHSSMG